MSVFKSLRQALTEFNNLEAIIKELTVLITH